MRSEGLNVITSQKFTLLNESQIVVLCLYTKAQFTYIHASAQI